MPITGSRSRTSPFLTTHPKISVWPDSYDVKYNMFNAAKAFVGGKVCSLDWPKMLAGQAAKQQCFEGMSEPDRRLHVLVHQRVLQDLGHAVEHAHREF